MKLTSEEAIRLEEKYGAHNYHPLPVVLSRGEGIYLYDLEGKRYDDFLAGYGAVNQGHCHPRLVAAATEQLKTLTLTSRAFYNDQLGLAEKAITEFFGYEKVLFMNSGAEANETALKLARRWGYEKKKVPANEAIIIAATGNFHGRTLGIISASTDPDSKASFGPYLPGYLQVEYGNIHELEKALENPNVVGFWVEPIQGEAGVILPPQGYLKRAAELCKQANVLTLIDEIQTGIGRTGKLNASDYEGVKPDLLILGKSLSGGILPISAVLAQDEVMLVLQPGQHGSTFGGNPLAARIVQEALAIVKEERLVENSFAQGNYFRAQLKKIKTHPDVKEIRGIGLMNAIEIHPESKHSAWEICLKMKEIGLLAKPTHSTIIRLTPPLVITPKQVDDAVAKIESAFF